MTTVTDALSGATIAAVIAAAAYATRMLSSSGAVAATLIGAAAYASGTRFAALLVAYFVVASVASHAGRERKRDARTVTGESGPRVAAQVLANGGAFALAALTAATDTRAGAFAAGALAASLADTLATEVGLLARAAPRSLTSGRHVAPGTSGGITMVGTAAGTLGACFVAVLAAAMGIARPGAVVLGGIAGMWSDSLIGAVLQERRVCPRCGVATEARVHQCGEPTARVGGAPGLDNDGVNLAATIAGGLAALALTSVS